MIRRETVDALLDLADQCDAEKNERLMERIVAFLEDRIYVIKAQRKGNAMSDVIEVKRARARTRLKVLYDRAAYHESKQIEEALPEDLADLSQELKLAWLRTFRDVYESSGDTEIAHRAARENVRRLHEQSEVRDD